MFCKRSDFMAQAMVNFRMNEDLKRNMEQTCKEMGLSMTTAFTIFANKVTKEKRIPFEIAVEPDPFYSETNINRLRVAAADAKAGRNMTVHELIEVDDD
jgi:DNA-damage-inducible protein J